MDPIVSEEVLDRLRSGRRPLLTDFDALIRLAAGGDREAVDRSARRLRKMLNDHLALVEAVLDAMPQGPPGTAGARMGKRSPIQRRGT